MKKKLILKILFLILILTLGCGVFWSWSITKKVRENNKNSNLKNQHAIVKNIVVTETKQEKKFWEFYAKSGEYNSAHNQVQLNDIIGNFYDKEGNVVVSFRSNKGTYDEISKKVTLDGDNLFVGKDGSQLFANKIVWQGEDKDILANGNIQFIKQNQFIVKSQKAVFSSDLTKFKIIGKTKTMLFSNGDSMKKFSKI